MRVEFSKQFQNQYLAMRNDALRRRLREVVLKVESATTIRDIPNIKKLTACSSAFRIRMGAYRIGLHINGDTAIFADFDHRKDIYTRFP
jgi:mRNA interferase RelE/StbE